MDQKIFHIPDNIDLVEKTLEGLIESAGEKAFMIVYAFALGARAQQLEDQEARRVLDTQDQLSN